MDRDTGFVFERLGPFGQGGIGLGFDEAAQGRAGILVELGLRAAGGSGGDGSSSALALDPSLDRRERDGELLGELSLRDVARLIGLKDALS